MIRFPTISRLTSWASRLDTASRTIRNVVTEVLTHYDAGNRDAYGGPADSDDDTIDQLAVELREALQALSDAQRHAMTLAREAEARRGAA